MPNTIQLKQSQTQFRIPVGFAVVDTESNQVLFTSLVVGDHRSAYVQARGWLKGFACGDPNPERFKIVRASAQVTLGDVVEVRD